MAVDWLHLKYGGLYLKYAHLTHINTWLLKSSLRLYLPVLNYRSMLSLSQTKTILHFNPCQYSSSSHAFLSISDRKIAALYSLLILLQVVVHSISSTIWITSDSLGVSTTESNSFTCPKCMFLSVNSNLYAYDQEVHALGGIDISRTIILGLRGNKTSDKHR